MAEIRPEKATCVFIWPSDDDTVLIPYDDGFLLFPGMIVFSVLACFQLSSGPFSRLAFLHIDLPLGFG
ncbi:MAG: hypothetical protein AB7P69_06290 [Candidatus Binatia bacterium]